MKIELSNQKKKQLERMHDSARDGRVRDRIKAVLLTSEGWSTSMISQALRNHETTVTRHINDYLQSEKLKPENGGSQSKLNAIETMALIEHLSEHTYFHTHQIVAYVQSEFKITYTVADMYKWLHSHNFSYKQPKDVPHKFNSEAQRDFIEYYCELKQCDEPILFMDAVHPSQATKITYGWSAKVKIK